MPAPESRSTIATLFTCYLPVYALFPSFRKIEAVGSMSDRQTAMPNGRFSYNRAT